MTRAGETWTVLRLMRWSGEYLQEKGVERGRLDAEHLLAHALSTERLQLYLEFDRPLDTDELARFRPLLKRRAAREPLQYILGRVGFRELDLGVDRRALIPRQETEVLVEEVLRWVEAQGRDGLTVVDLGTGSGAIALSLAREGAFSQVVATDVSSDALELARANAAELDAQPVVEFLQGSWFEALPAGRRFDVLVSNPPYVAKSDASTLEPEVGEWEPVGALFGGDDGLDLIREIVRGAPARLASGGLLALEVGLGQSDAVVALMKDTGEFEDASVRRDLTGRDRVVLARRM